MMQIDTTCNFGQCQQETNEELDADPLYLEYYFSQINNKEFQVALRKTSLHLKTHFGELLIQTYKSAIEKTSAHLLQSLSDEQKQMMSDFEASLNR